MTTRVISFATTEFRSALRRLKLQTDEFPDDLIFDGMTERELGGDFWSDHHKFISLHKKGFGLWIWKPHVILRSLRHVMDGTILVYIDAGCHLNPAGVRRWREYLDVLNSGEHSILAFDYSVPVEHGWWATSRPEIWTDRQFTKAEVVTHMESKGEVSQFLDSPSIAAGIVLIRANDTSRALIEEWNETLTSNPNLLTDVTSQKGQHPSFIAHRHDQSVFSLLTKMRGAHTFSAFETWIPKRLRSPELSSSLDHYPIHARRDLQTTFFDSLSRRMVPRNLRIPSNFG